MNSSDARTPSSIGGAGASRCQQHQHPHQHQLASTTLAQGRHLSLANLTATTTTRFGDHHHHHMGSPSLSLSLSLSSSSLPPLSLSSSSLSSSVGAGAVGAVGAATQPSATSATTTLTALRSTKTAVAAASPKQFEAIATKACNSSLSSSTSTSSTSTALETTQIQLYLKKRDSRASIAASSLLLSDTASGTGTGTGGRPISADSKDEDSPKGTPPTSSSSSSTATNIVSLRTTDSAGGGCSSSLSRTSRLITVHPATQMERRSRSSMASELNTESKGADESSLSSRAQVTKPKPTFINDVIWQAFQVDDTVYCGGIDAVLNLNMLCRLNIEYIVDLSGIDDDAMPRNRRGECPCLCSRRTAHSRVIMAINVVEEKPGQPYKQDLTPYFEDFIALIHKAKSLGKCVLVHSHYGRNRAPAFIAAYLMHQNRLSRVQAILKINESMSKMRPGICISDTLQRALMRWQTALGIRNADSGARSGSGSNEQQHLSVPLFSIKRTAWT